MKVYLDTIGCRLNQAEIEQYARQFRLAGHTLVADPAQADLAVVNTCAVTAAASSDSRQKIRRIGRLGVDEIIATGCWATLKPHEAAGLPGVAMVVPNATKDDLVTDLLRMHPEDFDLEPIERQTLPGLRQRTRLFIKVQDGCDNRCTFCITTLARGPGRSRTIPQVLAEIHASGDAKEIVLTGVHLGSWGQDLQPRMQLRDLVLAILQETGTPRLRLSSLEPWDLEEDFFSLWEDVRLCPHLHLPLQSGSAATLRRMARKTTPASFAALVHSARKVFPDFAITTDLIAGFPGETEAEFQESLEFVRQLGLAGGHVFTYSARPDTAAACMPGQVLSALRKERSALLRHVLAEACDAYRRRFIGHSLPVLWESASGLGPQGWAMSGLTGNYLRVRAYASQGLWNQITSVQLLEAHADGIFGKIQQQPGLPA
jgi:threonylcarbamoyladenosine tRNA methylthiotransferase MtaB